MKTSLRMCLGFVALMLVAVSPGADSMAKRSDDSGRAAYGPGQSDRAVDQASPRRRPADQRGGEPSDLRRPDQRMREFSREHREAVIFVIRDLRGLNAEDEQKLRDMNPEEFNAVFREHGSRILWLARLRERQPDLYRLRIDEMTLGRKLNEMAAVRQRAEAQHRGDEVDRIETEMRAVLAEQFDVMMRARELEVQLLEQRVEAMRAGLKDQLESRDEIIERRLERLRLGPDANDRPNARRDGRNGDRNRGGRKRD